MSSDAERTILIFGKFWKLTWMILILIFWVVVLVLDYNSPLWAHLINSIIVLVIGTPLLILLQGLLSWPILFLWRYFESRRSG